jgi:flagellar biosynthesis regulator FlaF
MTDAKYDLDVWADVAADSMASDPQVSNEIRAMIRDLRVLAELEEINGEERTVADGEWSLFAAFIEAERRVGEN